MIPSRGFSGPSSPHELPSGRLVCSDHRFVVCPYCCTDYSFMDEVLGYNDDEDSVEDFDDDDDSLSDMSATTYAHIGAITIDQSPAYQEFSGYAKESFPGITSPDLDHSSPRSSSIHIPHDLDDKPRIGLGRVKLQKFNPPRPTDTPSALFHSGLGEKAIPPVNRFIRRTNPSEFLIYTDGACLDNGSANARSGCAFVFRPSAPGSCSHSTFRLENRGPTGELYQHTSNRAELRAVIAALRFRAWTGEGFNSLVIATDSEYVVEGATRWVRTWLRNGWVTRTGAPVKNKDLWQALLGEAERWSEQGMAIKFWRIPRNLNEEADHWARHGANMQEVPDEFSDILGVLV